MTDEELTECEEYGLDHMLELYKEVARLEAEVKRLRGELEAARKVARRLTLIVLAQEDIGKSFARVLKEYPWVK